VRQTKEDMQLELMEGLVEEPLLNTQSRYLLEGSIAEKTLR
jgi:hypothetical protein